jgi:arylsulfatase A-like enzyme
MKPSFGRLTSALCAVIVPLLSACPQHPAPAPPGSQPTSSSSPSTRVALTGWASTAPQTSKRPTWTVWRAKVRGPQSDAPVPLTRPSHVSLFTGRYPSEHGIRDNLSLPLSNDLPLLSSIFKQAAFATAAFVASSVLDRQSGLARGFDVYSDRFEAGTDQRTGDRVAAEAIGWLRSPPKPKFFAWVHLYDPHAPYTPPEPYATRYAGRPYDGEVAWCDELVGRIVTALGESGVLNNTLIIVTSDHGEALGEHDEDVQATSSMRQRFACRSSCAVRA